MENKYTSEQIEQARTNRDKSIDCPAWMLVLFESCPPCELLNRSPETKLIAKSSWYTESAEYISDAYAAKLLNQIKEPADMNEQAEQTKQIERLKANDRPTGMLSEDDREFLIENAAECETYGDKGKWEKVSFPVSWILGATVRLRPDFELPAVKRWFFHLETCDIHHANDHQITELKSMDHLLEVQERDLPYLEKPEGDWEFRQWRLDDTIMAHDTETHGHGSPLAMSSDGHSDPGTDDFSGFRWCRPRKKEVTADPGYMLIPEEKCKSVAFPTDCAVFYLGRISGKWKICRYRNSGLLGEGIRYAVPEGYVFKEDRTEEDRTEEPRFSDCDIFEDDERYYVKASGIPSFPKYVPCINVAIDELSGIIGFAGVQFEGQSCKKNWSMNVASFIGKNGGLSVRSDKGVPAIPIAARFLIKATDV